MRAAAALASGFPKLGEQLAERGEFHPPVSFFKFIPEVTGRLESRDMNANTGERCGSAREFVDRVRLLVHRLNAIVPGSIGDRVSDRGRIHRILVILNGIHNQDIFRSNLRQQDRDVCSIANRSGHDSIQSMNDTGGWNSPRSASCSPSFGKPLASAAAARANSLNIPVQSASARSRCVLDRQSIRAR
jgi:hypothetical protein